MYVTIYMYVRHVSSILAFSLSSHRLILKFCLQLSLSRFIINNNLWNTLNGDVYSVTHLHLVEQYRGNGHFLSSESFSRHEAMVDDTLSRDSVVSIWVSVGLPSCLDRVMTHYIRGFLTFDLIVISRYFQFVLSCNPVYVRHVDSSTLTFSLSSYGPSFISLNFNSHFLDS